MPLTKSLSFGSLAACLALFLTGCQLPSSESMLVGPMSDASSSPRAGTKEAELPTMDSAKLCFTTAETLEKGGKDPEAIGLYEKARQLDKRLAVEATRRLAVLYDRNDEFDKALDYYRHALEENPKDAELLNDLGYGYYCRGEWAEAEKHLRKAVGVNPKYANAWINLGMTLAQQSRYDESIQAFGKVIPKAQAHCNVGFIQATQAQSLMKSVSASAGQLKRNEARRSYEAALQLEPGLQIARIAMQKLNQVSASESSAAAPEAPRTLPSRLNRTATSLDSAPVVVSPERIEK
ncbi:MAG TPA: tetratricopeptide repeat protein [Gemmataceae bacterium]|nr:tetratricopeptide repeat protein [Gemmataceae bacterium]